MNTAEMWLPIFFCTMTLFMLTTALDLFQLSTDEQTPLKIPKWQTP
jgi:hypothetical protein